MTDTPDLIVDYPEKIQVVSLKKTCAGCPSQWNGITDDNRKVYYRFRWGHLSVRVGEPGDMSEYAAVRGNEIFSASLSDGLDGELSTKDMLVVTQKKIRHQLPQKDMDAIAKFEADDGEVQ